MLPNVLDSTPQLDGFVRGQRASQRQERLPALFAILFGTQIVLDGLAEDSGESFLPAA